MDSREPAPIDIRAGGASLGDLQRRISIENTRATGDMANPKECDDVIFRRQAFQKVPHIPFSGKVQPPGWFIEIQHFGTAHAGAVSACWWVCTFEFFHDISDGMRDARGQSSLA